MSQFACFRHELNSEMKLLDTLQQHSQILMFWVSKSDQIPVMAAPKAALLAIKSFSRENKRINSEREGQGERWKIGRPKAIIYCYRKQPSSSGESTMFIDVLV